RQGDPHRPVPRPVVVFGRLCPRPWLLPGISRARILTARWHALAVPELFCGLVVAGIVASGPVEVVHGCHGPGGVCDNSQPKLGFPWERATRSLRGLARPWAPRVAAGRVARGYIRA